MCNDWRRTDRLVLRLAYFAADSGLSFTQILYKISVSRKIQSRQTPGGYPAARDRRAPDPQQVPQAFQ
jgi:hypothetical protein